MHISPRVKSVLAHVMPFLFHRERPLVQGTSESSQIIDSTEHRHEKYVSKVAQMVQLDNSLNIIDPIFGLLASPVAFQGRGDVHDVECLQVHVPFLFSSPDGIDRLQQMVIADLAFTNAKKIHDLDGQVAALIYRALERNTEGGPFCRPPRVRMADG